MLRIGAIGYRNHAARVIDIVKRSGVAEVSVVYHPTKVLDVPGATRRFEDLLDTDLVMVLSPNDTHLDYLERLAREFDGWVFCEKPPVGTLEELEALKLLPLERCRTFFNFNYRFSRLREVVQTAMEDRSLGRPIHMFVSMTQGLAYKKDYARSWRSDANRHRHGITETKAVHYVDMATVLFGPVTETTYQPVNVSGNGTAFDTCLIGLRHEHGAMVTLLMSYAAPLTIELKVVGTNGLVEYRDGKIRLYSPRDTFDERGYFAQPPCRYEYDFRTDRTDLYRDSLERSVRYFLEHATQDKPIDSAEFEMSLETNRLILSLHDQAPT